MSSVPCFSDCFGVLDCEWCMVDSDGKTHLDKPYCALQKECFGGIVGAKSPYADGLGVIGETNIDITCTTAFSSSQLVVLVYFWDNRITTIYRSQIPTYYNRLKFLLLDYFFGADFFK